MSGWGGVIELCVVFACVLGWGAVELRGLQLDKRKAEEAAKTGADTSKPDGSSAP